MVLRKPAHKKLVLDFRGIVIGVCNSELALNILEPFFCFLVVLLCVTLKLDIQKYLIHEKNTLLLSIESWLVIIGFLTMVYEIIPI